MGYIEQRKLDIFWSDEGPSRLFSVQARLNVDYQLSRSIGAFASVGYGDTRYYRTPYDTNFVSRPSGRLTLKVRMNQTGNSFHAKGTVNGVRRKAQHMRFNMIFNERAAIVHYFSPRYFAGATLVMNNSVFDDEAVTVNQNKWRARAFFGLRL